MVSRGKIMDLQKDNVCVCQRKRDSQLENPQKAYSGQITQMFETVGSLAERLILQVKHMRYFLEYFSR